MNIITPKKAFERMQADPNAVLVDVRETFEFADVHADGAKNIPLSILPLRIQELSGASEVFFICQSGGRSSQACLFAEKAGLQGASNVSGGTLAWVCDGLPTVGGSQFQQGSVRTMVLIVGAIVLAGALAMWSGLLSGEKSESDPASVSKSKSEASITRVPAKEFSQAVTQGEGTILDVRTPSEFAAGHIAGATLVDWNDPSFSSRVAELDRSKRYLVYCRSGNRSAQAVAAMRKMGFTDIVELQGGILSWEAAGLPVER